MKNTIFYLLIIPFIILSFGCSKNDINPASPDSYKTLNSTLQNKTVTSLCVSGNNIIAGTRGGIVYVSTDNGISWNGVDTLKYVGSFPGANFVMIANAIVYNAEGLTYAGTANALQGSVNISSDNGLTWIEKDTGFVQCVNCFNSVNGKVFAGTNDGVYLTTDNGTTWNAVNTGLTYNVNYYGHAPQVTSLLVQGTTLFAGTSGEGLFRSLNYGTSWSESDNGISNKDIYGLASVGSNIFAGVFQSFGDTSGGVFISNDNGSTWSPVNSGLTNRMLNVLYSNGSNLFAATNIGVYYSVNNGRSWLFLDSLSVSSFTYFGANILAGTSDGIIRISP